MIDPKEFRIGNFIADPLQEDTHRVIASLGMDYGLFNKSDGRSGAVYSSPDKIDPIPITPEWLERLGFEQHKFDTTEWGIKIRNESKPFYKGWFTIYSEDYATKIKSMFCPMGDYRNETSANFKYVHQLQNLYFALTAEELTIKEPEQSEAK